MGPGSHSHGGQKVKNAKFSWREFLRSIKPYRWAIIVAILLSVGSAATALFIPMILGEMTNIAVSTIETGLDWGAISGKAILVIVLFCLAAAMNYGQGFILAVTSAKYTRDLRREVIEKIGRLPISYFDKHKYGDTLSRMTNDIDVLATSLSQEIADTVLSLTTLVGVMIMMLTISVPLSLVSFIVIPVSVVVVGKITNFAQKYFHEQQATLGALNSKIEEDYAGQVVIKSNSYEKAARASFDETNKKYTKAATLAQIFSSISFPATHIFTNLGYIAICVMGGVFVLEGRINIGNVQAFLQYVSRFNRPITEIASTMATIQALLAASERVFEFLAEPEEKPDVEPSLTIDDIKGEVVFDHVNFGYLPGVPVIKNFSARIEPGMTVAIVGPTGAGKTTIVNLLMRFYEPNSGQITIDGVPTNQMKRADVRKLFGMVLQDTWLFSGTVEENLRYGNQKASLEQIIAAAKSSNVDHVIEALPRTYKTEISEDSDNISAGEKQLITIARAMVENPPMMILDEATSNVDTRTEQLIQDSFEKLTHGKTSFVIAHRLSTIRNADLILVMQNGNIVEQGNHETLLKANGFYAKLYNSQFAED